MLFVSPIIVNILEIERLISLNNPDLNKLFLSIPVDFAGIGKEIIFFFNIDRLFNSFVNKV